MLMRSKSYKRLLVTLRCEQNPDSVQEVFGVGGGAPNPFLFQKGKA